MVQRDEMTRGSESAPQRLDGLQVGRALAASSVVVSHAVGHLTGGTHGVWTMLSAYGVTLFFVISGYLMVATTGRGRFDGWSFIGRRIRRIVPIYYVANIVLAAVVLVAPTLFRRTVFEPVHFVQSLLFIPAYDPAGSGFIWPFFRLGWTLNYEMFFYGLFALLCGLSARLRATGVILALGGLMLIGQIHSFSAAIPNFYTQIAMVGFVFGTALGVVALDRPLRLGTAGAIGAAVASTILFAGLGSVYEAIRTAPWTQILMSIVATLHILLLIALIDWRARRAPAALLAIGDASYSIYLFHMLVVGAGVAVARRLPAELQAPTVAATAIVAIGVGLIVYRFVEAPLNRLFRGRRPLTAAQITSRAAGPTA